MRTPLRLETNTTAYELRFAPLHSAGGYFAVPCNEQGIVDLDQLDDDVRQAYFYAHMLIGRDFAKPAVCRIGNEPTGLG